MPEPSKRASTAGNERPSPKRYAAEGMGPPQAVGWVIGIVMATFASHLLAVPLLMRVGHVGKLLVGQLVVGGAFLGLSWAMGQFYPVATSAEGMGIRKPGKGWVWLPLSLIFGLALNVACEGLAQLYGRWVTEPPDMGAWLREIQAHGGIATGAALALCIVILGPLVEEWLFRGSFFAALRAKQGFWGSAIFSSLAFGMVHDPRTAPVIALAGVGLCVIREQSRQLSMAWVAHGGFNLLTVLYALNILKLPAQGVQISPWWSIPAFGICGASIALGRWLEGRRS